MKRYLFPIVLFLLFLGLMVFNSCLDPGVPQHPDKVAAPVIAPGSSTYTTAQSVTIACTTPETVIRYTTDGSTPGESNGTVYTTAFIVAESMTVQAIACRAGWAPSSIAAASFVFQGMIMIDPKENSYTVSLLNVPSMLIRNRPTTIQAVSNVTPDSYSWYVDGNLVATGSSNSYMLGTGLGIGMHNVTVTAAKEGVRYSKTASFTVVLFYAENFFDFENGSIPESFGASSTWVIAPGGAADSLYSLKSAAIGNNASTSAILNITPVIVPTNLVINFTRKVSTEKNYDKLALYINKVKVSPDWSGKLDWEVFSYSVTITESGTIPVEWRYTKDSIGNSGDDAVWIDNITLEQK